MLAELKDTFHVFIMLILTLLSRLKGTLQVLTMLAYSCHDMYFPCTDLDRDCPRVCVCGVYATYICHLPE